MPERIIKYIVTELKTSEVFGNIGSLKTVRQAGCRQRFAAAIFSGICLPDLTKEESNEKYFQKNKSDFV